MFFLTGCSHHETLYSLTQWVHAFSSPVCMWRRYLSPTSATEINIIIIFNLKMYQSQYNRATKNDQAHFPLSCDKSIHWLSRQAYIELSCSEILKKPYRELLVCTRTQCRASSQTCRNSFTETIKGSFWYFSWHCGGPPKLWSMSLLAACNKSECDHFSSAPPPSCPPATLHHLSCYIIRVQGGMQITDYYSTNTHAHKPHY